MHGMILDAFEPIVFGSSLTLEYPLPDPEPAWVLEEDLGQFRLDVLAMTTLLKSLTFALVVRSVEAELEEKEAGPKEPVMSPEDWTAYS